MTSKNVRSKTNVTRLIASVFGVLVALGGLTHGMGEIQQEYDVEGSEC
jgi:hypothetical protein